MTVKDKTITHKNHNTSLQVDHNGMNIRFP